MPIFNVELSTGEILKLDAPDENTAKKEAERYLSVGHQQSIDRYLSGGFQPSIGGAEALKEGLLNIPASTYRLGAETAKALLSPIETATTIKDLGVGLLQNVIPENITSTFMENDPEARELASKVGEHYINQYGSFDAVKRAFAEDPAFVLADLSTVFGIGAATTPGKVSAALRTAEKAVNPITQAGRIAKYPAKAAGIVASEILGLTSGTGSKPIIEAFNAAVAGGERGKEFLTQMRNPENVDSLVKAADLSLQDMLRKKNAEYQSLRTGISQDFTALDISPIQQKVSEQMRSLVSREGDVVDPNALKALNEAQDIINNWSDLTPIGLDGLKQRIYTLAPLDQPNTYRAIKSLYDQVKDTIVKQAPEYADMMKKYSEASDLINEIKRTLSINPQATVDTKIRKLLSTMRDNVNASFGRRAELVSELEKASGRQILSGLAGASLSPLTPRGLARIVPPAGGVVALGSGGASIPGWLAGLASTSPRLVGEAAYGTGLLQRTLPYALSPEVLNTLYQSQQAQNIGQQQ